MKQEVNQVVKMVKKLQNRVIMNSNCEPEIFSTEVGDIFEFYGEIPEETLQGWYLLDGIYMSFSKKAPTMMVVA